jgi:hydrazine synthase alpha subunit-like protein
MRSFLRYVLLVTVLCASVPCGPQARASEAVKRALPEVQVPLVVTQVEAGNSDRSRLVLVRLDGSTKVLSGDLFAARDPEVSFDGTRILFSAQETAKDRWAIYEMQADGTGRRRVIASDGDCRNPRYLSTLYTIVSDKPWYQIVFVGKGIDGAAGGPDLYSCKLDGSELGRLTYNLGRNSTPFLMPDGRLLFGVQYPGGRGGSIFGLNIDGTDYATFLGEQGQALNRMPSVTNRGLVVFVESDQPTVDGGGTLAAVSVRRPLHSYRRITEPGEGMFHSPAPGPAGTILVSRRSDGGGDTYGVVLLDPASRKLRVVFDDREYHDLQAQQIAPRPEPDGRSSVVTPKDPYGELYCLNVAESDDKSFTKAVKSKKVRTICVYEGKAIGEDETGLPIVEKHVLGEVPLAADGSFNLKVPANTPLQIHLLDDQGGTVRSCRWIWSRNHEPRGCIGCHEDGELTPENLFVDALKEPSILVGKDGSGTGSETNQHADGESE